MRNRFEFPKQVLKTISGPKKDTVPTVALKQKVSRDETKANPNGQNNLPRNLFRFADNGTAHFIACTLLKYFGTGPFRVMYLLSNLVFAK